MYSWCQGKPVEGVKERNSIIWLFHKGIYWSRWKYIIWYSSVNQIQQESSIDLMRDNGGLEDMIKLAKNKDIFWRHRQEDLLLRVGHYEKFVESTHSNMFQSQNPTYFSQLSSAVPSRDSVVSNQRGSPKCIAVFTKHHLVSHTPVLQSQTTLERRSGNYCFRYSDRTTSFTTWW